jgi:hypothetical protein
VTVVTEEDVLDAVTDIAALISSIPRASILKTSTLKGNLGLNKADLVQFSNQVTRFIKQFNSQGELPFEVANKKDQTVGGVATEAHKRLQA